MPPRVAKQLHGAGVRRWRPEDYASLLDEEVRDFIARTDRWFPPETAGLPIARQRAIYDAMCRDFHAGRPPATIVYFHGGGFVLGNLDSHDDICAVAEMEPVITLAAHDATIDAAPQP